MQDWLGVHRAAAPVGEHCPQLFGRGQPAHQQAVEQFVDHSRVAHQHPREIRARGTQPHVEIERPWMKAEQFPEHAFSAKRFADAGQVDKRGIGIRCGGDGGEQPRGDGGEKVATPPRGEEANLLLAERAEMPVGGGWVAEAMPFEQFRHPRRSRRRVEHKVGFGLGLLVSRKCVMQEVVEDRAIEPGGFLQFDIEGCQPVGTGRVAHPHGQGFAGRRVVRKGVGLCVEENLQPVLRGAEQGVGPLEHLAFFVGQPARAGQPPNRLKRVAGADLGRVAAAEQLEKLDRGFDIPDASPAHLHIPLVVAFADCPLLDPPFERFDAADVGPRQPTAVDPGLKLGQQPLAKRLAPRRRPRLDPRLPFPGAAERVEILQHCLDRHHHRA